MSVSATVQKHSQNEAGFTEYFIVVFYKGCEWGIRKRYSDFVRFNEYMLSQGYKLSCKLRGKNFWNKYDPTLITRRLSELQGYLNGLLISTMTDNNLVKEFLEVDEHMLAEAKKLSMKNRETAFTDRLDRIVKDTRKAVILITGPQRLGTNMHSAAQRAIQQQQRNLSVSSGDKTLTDSTSGVAGNSPGHFLRRFSSGTATGSSSPEPSQSIGSPKSARSRTESREKSSGGDGNKEALNYAFGTGSMAQTHLNEDPVVSSGGSSARVSPSTSFSGYDGVLTGLIRRDSTGLLERKDSWGGMERKQTRAERCPSTGSGKWVTVSGPGGPPGPPLSRWQHGAGMRSSAKLDAALALVDSRRREHFARHVTNLWNKEVVSNMGRILREKRSKKRLPLVLSQHDVKREGMKELSELWEKSQQEATHSEAAASMIGSTGPASGDPPDEGYHVEGLQEEIIFKDDENTWILDLLTAPLDIDPLLALLDREVQAMYPPFLYSPADVSAACAALSVSCVVKPKEVWAAFYTEETQLLSPQHAKSEGPGSSSNRSGKDSSGLPPRSPRPPTAGPCTAYTACASPSAASPAERYGLRSLGDDNQLLPLVQATSGEASPRP